MKKLLSIALIFAALFAGCRNTGNVFRLEQRSVAGITSISFGEYVLPVVSISTGPSVDVWQSKDSPCFMKIEGTACTTNETSALGIYNSKEHKQMNFAGIFISSNKVEYVVK